MSRFLFVGRGLLILDMLMNRPPGMYKAVSGMKKSPTDQGELSGILQKLGYDKDQVSFFENVTDNRFINSKFLVG